MRNVPLEERQTFPPVCPKCNGGRCQHPRKCHMYLVAFDPGETTGYAEFNDAGECINYGQLKFDDLVEYCHGLEPRVVVLEDFRIRKNKARAFVGSRMETIQAIGVIRSLAKLSRAKYVLQDSSILPLAQKWTQVKMPLDHSRSHWVSAFNHGAYYLINQGKRKTELERSSGL